MPNEAISTADSAHQRNSRSNVLDVPNPLCDHQEQEKEIEENHQSGQRLGGSEGNAVPASQPRGGSRMGAPQR